MGLLVSKKTCVNLPESTDLRSCEDSSLIFFTLPNELLHMILSYLSSIDIVRAFFNINSDRIQALLPSYLARFNLVSGIINDEQWIKTYFTRRSPLSRWILSLRLTNRQMKLCSKYHVQFVQLQSFSIVNMGDNSALLLDILEMAPSLHTLSLDFSPDDMSRDSRCCLARIVFSGKTTWQQQLETLSMTNIHIPFGFNCLQPMLALRHLTISLRYENQLLDLCSYLPRLESLCVHVRSSSAISSDRSLNRLHVSPYLRKLIISGRFYSHSQLYEFILIYKSSLQHLRLINISHPDLVDGHQLRSELVQHLPRLIRFQFQFQFPVNVKEFHADSYVKTFNEAQIIIYPSVESESVVVVVSSLPTFYSSCHLACDHLLDLCRSKTTMTLSTAMSSVRTLQFSGRCPLTVDVLNFIIQTFSRLHTVIFEYESAYGLFLGNQYTVFLDSVRKLIVDMMLVVSRMDCLLKLCRNVHQLHIKNTDDHIDDGDSILTQHYQIKYVQVMDTLTLSRQQFLHRYFPNATIVESDTFGK